MAFISSAQDSVLLKQLIESYRAAHPQTPYREQDLLNAALEISLKAQTEGGIAALYPEQATFIRTALGLFSNNGTSETLDAAGHARFQLIGKDPAKIQLAVQKLSNELHLPFKKAVPYYNGFAAMADLANAMAMAGTFPDGRIMLTPTEYEPYGEGNAAQWLAGFEAHAGPLKADDHGIVMMPAATVKELKKTAERMAQSGRDSDYTRCRRFLSFDAPIAPEYDQLKTVCDALDGAIVYSM